MSPADFIQDLLARQVRLQAENGQLRFFAKPGALTPELRAAIVARKAELLEFLQHTTPSTDDATSPKPWRTAITRVPRENPLPLSSAQERLWFLDQLEGASATYNVYDAWHLRGPVNAEALAFAVREFVHRHEALRTTFVAADTPQGVVQRVQPALEVPLVRADLTDFTGPDRWNEAVRIANELIRQSFDLARGPLVRTLLVTIAPDEALFIFVVHHIVFDGWSNGIMRREMAELYSAFLTRNAPALPPLALHYGDYAAWESGYLAGVSAKASLEFWRRYLTGAPMTIDLPTDFNRPAAQTYRGNHTRTVIPRTLVEHLRDFGRLEQATLFHVVMTAWKILLLRYSGKSELLVGTTISNRKWPELEPVVGFFVNTLPLRTRLDDDITVRQALRRVRESAVDALSHDEIPFERLVQALNPNRDMGVAPVFQVCLSYLRETEGTLRCGDLELEPVQLDPHTSKFDLTLWVTETAGDLRISLEYSTDLFVPERAERMLEHFGRILTQMADHPADLIRELPLLTEPERQRVFAEWNNTRREYPRERGVHELFEEQVRRQPGAPAVIFGEQSLTYAGLNQRANRLAGRLRARGVGPDVLVGLCVERSLDMVVGLLGILKAGGAYVPIDPAYPADRIAAVLEDSRAPVLVTQRALLALLPKTGADRILLDELPSGAEPEAAVPLSGFTSDNLAYVIYTSGSTGQPKGVQISHRAVVNFLNSMRREPGLTDKDVLLAVTTLSFDIAGLELHLPLTTGATIVLASRENVADGAALLGAIDRHGVTVLQATPTTWRLMLAAGWTGTPGLKALCGGEALPVDLAGELIPRCAELWNMYGPTETTIWSTCTRITRAEDIHIGRPIDNTEIQILDSHLQPLPIGVSGELLIGGDGLARGYLGRPELTAERFIAHPFKPGARLYRTGDLARYRFDGAIECLGRLDFQVKIRGFRIELGEIETRLAAYPDIRQCVVVAREDTPGSPRLVAYVVPRPTASPNATSLREHLRGKLPEYMLPAVFVSISVLPLTPNGKIDRKALPAPEAMALGSTRQAIAPRTEVEKRLTTIFEKVLGNKVASVQDSFFDLGGHSLLAVKLMAAIEREFGARLPLARLFEAPNIEQLALSLARPETNEDPWSSLMPIRPRSEKPTLFLVHGAGGNVLLYREVTNALGPDVSVYGFQSQGLDRRARPLRTIEEMAAHYVGELQAFQPHGPYNVGGYCMGGAVAFEMARLLRARGEIVSLVALLDSYNLATVKNSTLRPTRLSVFRQKAAFHFQNLIRIRKRNLPSYLGEKMRMAVELARASWAARWARQRHASAGGADEPGAEVMIQKINDQAGWQYAPRPITGSITVFRPQKNYNFMPDPQLGWSGVAPDGIDLVTLPVNPHAMLIAPCAVQLARELRSRILQPAAVAA